MEMECISVLFTTWYQTFTSRDLLLPLIKCSSMYTVFNSIRKWLSDIRSHHICFSEYTIHNNIACQSRATWQHINNIHQVHTFCAKSSARISACVLNSHHGNGDTEITGLLTICMQMALLSATGIVKPALKYWIHRITCPFKVDFNSV